MNRSDTEQADEAAAADNFGAEVRQLRRARGMTLQDLAADSGVSVSHLSAIERGKANASLRNIQRIASGLGVPTQWFFHNPSGNGPLERAHVVRSRNRRNLNALYGETPEESGYYDELLSSSIGGDFYLGISRYAPNDGRRPVPRFCRDGEMHGVVIEGELLLTLEDEQITLRKGDSFSIPGRITHSIDNPGDTPAHMIWVNAPVIIPRLLAQWTLEGQGQHATPRTSRQPIPSQPSNGQPPDRGDQE